VNRWEPQISQNYSSDGNLISIKIKRTMDGEWEQIHPLVEREWVGLTDDEIWDCYTDQGKRFYLAIETKLKEKNT